MDEIIKVEAKYVFLDVVGYTNETIEAQFEIVQELQVIVKKSIRVLYFFGSLSDHVWYLPTGDGICVALVGDKRDDIHMLVALEVLNQLSEHNRTGKQRFSIRIGVNENKDIVYWDINSKKNFAGRGINFAQRFMNLADSGQIVVGPSVFEKLGQTNKYNGKFKEYFVTLKHNKKIQAYQFVDASLPFLNSAEIDI